VDHDAAGVLPRAAAADAAGVIEPGPLGQGNHGIGGLHPCRAGLAGEIRGPPGERGQIEHSRALHRGGGQALQGPGVGEEKMVPVRVAEGLEG